VSPTCSRLTVLTSLGLGPTRRVENPRYSRFKNLRYETGRPTPPSKRDGTFRDAGRLRVSPVVRLGVDSAATSRPRFQAPICAGVRMMDFRLMVASRLRPA